MAACARRLKLLVELLAGLAVGALAGMLVESPAGLSAGLLVGLPEGV